MGERWFCIELILPFGPRFLGRIYTTEQALRAAVGPWATIEPSGLCSVYAARPKPRRAP